MGRTLYLSLNVTITGADQLFQGAKAGDQQRTGECLWLPISKLKQLFKSNELFRLHAKEFSARGRTRVRCKDTEVVLTHERFPNTELRDRHQQGWTGCLARLSKSL